MARMRMWYLYSKGRNDHLGLTPQCIVSDFGDVWDPWKYIGLPLTSQKMVVQKRLRISWKFHVFWGIGVCQGAIMQVFSPSSFSSSMFTHFPRKWIIISALQTCRLGYNRNQFTSHRLNDWRVTLNHVQPIRFCSQTLSMCSNCTSYLYCWGFFFVSIRYRRLYNLEIQHGYPKFTKMHYISWKSCIFHITFFFELICMYVMLKYYVESPTG